jgi:hypothetical protein
MQIAVEAWGVAGGLYGLALAGSGLVRPVARRGAAVASALAFAILSLTAGWAAAIARPDADFWIQLLAPGALLLSGYWMSGLFIHAPQPWLERALLAGDRAVAAHRWQAAMPRALGELLELAYAAVYPLVAGAALYVAASAPPAALAAYWTLVLGSGLASYAAIPWLRCRPPRVVEALSSAGGSEPCVSGEGLPTRRRLSIRRLNTFILDRASIQANTVPSGHVACATAAAMSVMSVDPAAGVVVSAAAIAIAAGAVAGRYHYLADCAAGAVVPLVVSSLM